MDPYSYSPAELKQIASEMNDVNEAIYWHMFRRGFGSKCHAFLEFNGLMSKYQELCRKAADSGIDFTNLNVHSGRPLPMEDHDVAYLAEKFECIFGSFFKTNPDLALLFAERALGLQHDTLAPMSERPQRDDEPTLETVIPKPAGVPDCTTCGGSGEVLCEIPRPGVNGYGPCPTCRPETE